MKSIRKGTRKFVLFNYTSVGNGEIPRSLWPISLIFPEAPENVLQNNAIQIIFTYKTKLRGSQ